MIKLNEFIKIDCKKKRYGRGGAYGGTCGRGHKGYKARSGSSVKGFEGGQTPIYRRLPMRGFNSRNDNVRLTVTMKSILEILRSDNCDVIDNNFLYKKNIIHDLDEQVKLIGSNVELKNIKNLSKIDVARVSKGVIQWAKENNVSVVLDK